MSVATHRTRGETFAGYTNLVVETCCDCGVMFAMPGGLQRARREDRGSFYCPNGHGMHYAGETDRERLQRERDLRAAERAAREQAEASAAAQKRAATRARNERNKARKRSADGVCPCCGRTFKQVARHMDAKHPDYDPRR